MGCARLEDEIKALSARLCCVQAERMTPSNQRTGWGTSSWYLPENLCLVPVTCPLTFSLLSCWLQRIHLPWFHHKSIHINLQPKVPLITWQTHRFKCGGRARKSGSSAGLLCPAAVSPQPANGIPVTASTLPGGGTSVFTSEPRAIFRDAAKIRLALIPGAGV